MVDKNTIFNDPNAEVLFTCVSYLGNAAMAAAGSRVKPLCRFSVVQTVSRQFFLNERDKNDVLYIRVLVSKVRYSQHSLVRRTWGPKIVAVNFNDHGASPCSSGGHVVVYDESSA